MTKWISVAVGLVFIVLLAISLFYVYFQYYMRSHADDLSEITMTQYMEEYSLRRENGTISDEYRDMFDELVEALMQPDVRNTVRHFVFTQIMIITSDRQVSEEERVLIENLTRMLEDTPDIDPMEIYEFIHD